MGFSQLGMPRSVFTVSVDPGPEVDWVNINNITQDDGVVAEVTLDGGLVSIGIVGQEHDFYVIPGSQITGLELIGKCERQGNNGTVFYSAIPVWKGTKQGSLTVDGTVTTSPQVFNIGGSDKLFSVSGINAYDVNRDDFGIAGVLTHTGEGNAKGMMDYQFSKIYYTAPNRRAILAIRMAGRLKPA